jgi:hypothetical protein
LKHNSGDGAPELRAAVSNDGVIVMTRWAPWNLQAGGPAASQVRSTKLAVVSDLSIARETQDGITIPTDLIVQDEFIFGDSAACRLALLAWAERLGYQRVWFHNQLAVLEPELLGGIWAVGCHGCGVTWSDSTARFWLGARAAGYFPLSCPLCAHALVQPVELFDLGSGTTRDLNPEHLLTA